MGKLDVDYGPLSELVKTDKVFAVPDYQRSYSWKPRKQVAALWGDIARVYSSPDEDGDGELDSHFIGSVVTGAGKVRALGPTQVPIIDGQQRLITLSLILCAIRDVVIAPTSPGAAGQVTREYLTVADGDESVTRVLPGSKDRDSYERIVRGLDVKEPKSQVARAYAYIVDEIRKGPGEESDPDEGKESPEAPVLDEASLEAGDVRDELEVDDSDDDVAVEAESSEARNAVWDWERLLTVVTAQLELVSIADVPDDKAYQIFASLNSTGLALSQVDLVRNAVFMLLSDKEAKKAHNEVWRPLEAVFGKQQLESYLHTWVIRRGHNVPLKDMYQRMLKELRAATTRDVLDQLLSDAWAFSAVIRPTDPIARSTFANHSLPPNLATQLERLREWGNVPLRPVLLEVMLRYQNGTLSAKEAARALSWLESFVVRRYANQVPPNDLRSVFARIAGKLSALQGDEVDFIDALKAELLEPARRWPSDSELRNAFLQRPLYRKRTNSQTFQILKRLAEDMQGKECPVIKFGRGSTEFSIEHVLPRNPTHWLVDLANWGDPDPAETIELLSDTIGNLTLTAYNSELSNSAFSVKREWIESKVSLKLTTAILAQDEWTRSEIESRGEDLWKRAIKLWPRP